MDWFSTELLCYPLVQIDLRSGVATELFTCQTVKERSFMSVVHLNAIAIDPRNPNLFSVVGADEFARLFDIRKYKWDGSTDFGQPVDFFCPTHLLGEHVGITGLAFSDRNELLVSYSNEFIYLFSKDIGLGPHPVPPSPGSSGGDATEMGHDPTDMEADGVAGLPVYKGHRNLETVKGVNFFGPKCEYVVSGSDCGRIFIWKKDGELIHVMEADKHVVNCIEPHPHTMMLASCGIENDIKLWTPKAIERAIPPTNVEKMTLTTTRRTIICIMMTVVVRTIVGSCVMMMRKRKRKKRMKIMIMTMMLIVSHWMLRMKMMGMRSFMTVSLIVVMTLLMIWMMMILVIPTLMMMMMVVVVVVVTTLVTDNDEI